MLPAAHDCLHKGLGQQNPGAPACFGTNCGCQRTPGNFQNFQFPSPATTWKVTHEGQLSPMGRMRTSPGMGSQGCSVPVELFGTGCAFPQARGCSEPVKTSTVCVLWNYRRGLRKETPPGRHSQMGRGNTGSWRGLWDPSGKRSDLLISGHALTSSSTIVCPAFPSLWITAQRGTTCSKAIPLCRKVPPAAAAAVPLSLLRAPTEPGLISLVEIGFGLVVTEG